MNVTYKPSFHRYIEKITDPTVKENVDLAISSVKAAMSPQGIPRLKKMKGAKGAYRIRVGNYRIGITIEGNTVTFESFGLRKDFYKSFP